MGNGTLGKMVDLWEIVQWNRWFMEDVTLGEMVYDRLVY